MPAPTPPILDNLGSLENQTSAVQTVNANSVKIMEAFEDFFDEFNALVQKVETESNQQVSAVAQRVTVLETTLPTVQTAVTSLTSRTTQAEGTITTHGSRLASLETSRTSVITRLNNHDSDITSLDGRVDVLETWQTVADGRYPLKTDFVALDAVVDGHESRIVALEALPPGGGGGDPPTWSGTSSYTFQNDAGVFYSFNLIPALTNFVEVITVPQFGTLHVTETGPALTVGALLSLTQFAELRFTPNGTTGATSFQIKAIGAGGSATITVNLTITIENSAPVGVDDNATVTYETATLIDVLFNDTDPDGNALTVTAATAPLHGTADVDVPTNSILYTPDAGYFGPDEFEYTVSDGITTSTGRVFVTIPQPNQAPNAPNTARTVATGTTLTPLALTWPTDPEGDSFTGTYTTAPVTGRLGTVTIIPGNPGNPGPDITTYTWDGQVDGDIVTTVNPEWIGSSTYRYTGTGGIRITGTSGTRSLRTPSGVTTGAEEHSFKTTINRQAYTDQHSCCVRMSQSSSAPINYIYARLAVAAPGGNVTDWRLVAVVNDVATTISGTQSLTGVTLPATLEVKVVPFDADSDNFDIYVNGDWKGRWLYTHPTAGVTGTSSTQFYVGHRIDAGNYDTFGTGDSGKIFNEDVITVPGVDDSIDFIEYNWTAQGTGYNPVDDAEWVALDTLGATSYSVDANGRVQLDATGTATIGIDTGLVEHALKVDVHAQPTDNHRPVFVAGTSANNNIFLRLKATSTASAPGWVLAQNVGGTVTTLAESNTPIALPARLELTRGDDNRVYAGIDGDLVGAAGGYAIPSSLLTGTIVGHQHVGTDASIAQPWLDNQRIEAEAIGGGGAGTPDEIVFTEVNTGAITQTTYEGLHYDPEGAAGPITATAVFTFTDVNSNSKVQTVSIESAAGSAPVTGAAQSVNVTSANAINFTVNTATDADNDIVHMLITAIPATSPLFRAGTPLAAGDTFPNGATLTVDRITLPGVAATETMKYVAVDSNGNVSAEQTVTFNISAAGTASETIEVDPMNNINPLVSALVASTSLTVTSQGTRGYLSRDSSNAQRILNGQTVTTTSWNNGLNYRASDATPPAQGETSSVVVDHGGTPWTMDLVSATIPPRFSAPTLYMRPTDRGIDVNLTGLWDAGGDAVNVQIIEKPTQGNLYLSVADANAGTNAVALNQSLTYDQASNMIWHNPSATTGTKGQIGYRVSENGTSRDITQPCHVVASSTVKPGEWLGFSRNTTFASMDGFKAIPARVYQGQYIDAAGVKYGPTPFSTVTQTSTTVNATYPDIVLDATNVIKNHGGRGVYVQMLGSAHSGPSRNIYGVLTADINNRPKLVIVKGGVTTTHYPVFDFSLGSLGSASNTSRLFRSTSNHHVMGLMFDIAADPTITSATLTLRHVQTTTVFGTFVHNLFAFDTTERCSAPKINTSFETSGVIPARTPTGPVVRKIETSSQWAAGSNNEFPWVFHAGAVYGGAQDEITTANKSCNGLNFLWNLGGTLDGVDVDVETLGEIWVSWWYCANRDSHWPNAGKKISGKTTGALGGVGGENVGNIGSGGRMSDGSDGFSQRGDRRFCETNTDWLLDPNRDLVGYGDYTYGRNDGNTNGSTIHANTGTSIFEWHHVERRLKMESGPWAYDSESEMYINGYRVMERFGHPFMGPTIGNDRFKYGKMWVCNYHGGVGVTFMPGPLRIWGESMYGVVAARERIGPVIPSGGLPPKPRLAIDNAGTYTGRVGQQFVWPTTGLALPAGADWA